MKLYGSHHFALSAVKEVAVTPSFLSLSEATRRCQLNETLHGCQTRKYMELLLLTCHCLPFHLKTDQQVKVGIEITLQQSLTLQLHFSLMIISL